MKWVIERTVPTAVLPRRAYDGDAGYDLFTCYETIWSPISELIRFDLGIRVEPPAGWWMEIRGRSSTPHRHGLHVRSCVIDNGYRGELFILAEPAPAISGGLVPVGARLAQLIPHEIKSIDWEEGRVSESERGTRGFGSSGA